MISGLCPTRGEGSFAGCYDIATVGISRQCPVLCFAPVSAPQRYLYLGWDTRYTNEDKAYFDVAMSGSSDRYKEREKHEAVDVNSAGPSSALTSSLRMPGLSPPGDPSPQQATVKMAADLGDTCEVLGLGFKDIASTIVGKLDNVSKEIGG